MFKRIRGERGFTLLELSVVLVILAILIAVVVPNFTGFLGRGKQASFNADRNTIQAAVNAYYTGSTTANKWPTDGGGNSSTDPGVNNAYIDFSDLLDFNFLKSAPASASNTYNISGTTNGSYGWYIDEVGIVQGGNTNDGTGFNGNYP